MNKFYVLMVSLLILQTPVWAQGWIQHYNSNTNYNGLGSVSTTAYGSGYIVGGVEPNSSTVQDVLLVKTDTVGHIDWTYTLLKAGNQNIIGIEKVSSNNSYLVVYSDSTLNIHLLSLSSTGQFISDLTTNQTSPFFGHYTRIKTTLTSDEYLLLAGSDTSSTGNTTVKLVKMDLSGSIIWSQTYTSPSYQSYEPGIIETNDNNYALLSNMDSMQAGIGTVISISKLDTAGAIIWNKTHTISIYNRAYSLIQTSDGGFLVMGGADGFNGTAQMMVLKLDAMGEELWRWLSPYGSPYFDNKTTDAVENTDGSYTVVGSFLGFNGYANSSIAFMKFGVNGDSLLMKGLSTGQGISLGLNIYASNTGYTIFGSAWTWNEDVFLLGTDTLGKVYSNTVRGNLYYDLNGNCVKEVGEPSIQNRVVEAKKGNKRYYGSSDANGDYTIEVDTGDYMITAQIYPPSPLWETCIDSQLVQFGSFNAADTINFGLYALDTCSFMNVDISALFLRRCFPGVYHVNYSNWGTKQIDDGYVEVTLDPYLTFDSSSIALTSQIGNVYRFDLDTVPIGANGLFRIYVTVGCDSVVLGQTHCTKAHIYPDTLCIPNYWTGPIIQASSICDGDSVSFTIQNVGTAMSVAQHYSIIEEHVMIQFAPFTLGMGQSQTITIPAMGGATYRMEVGQSAGFPSLLGDSIAITNAVGCNDSQPVNIPNILGQFYNDNSNPAISIDCQENRGSYDPNDKQAQPLGYGAQHYIENNISLSYHIRFQNTGTDTAFKVKVIDTLDLYLDPSSLQMGVSSHNYTWTLREGNILEVVFDNIMLADSNINEALSHGFFKFKINQTPNNPDGSMIYNRAGIYFDFNAAVMTNQVFHTIGKDFVSVVITGTEDILVEENIEIRVYPNPFEEQTTLEVVGGDYQELQLKIYDVMGREVLYKDSLQAVFTSNNKIQIQRGNLPQGVYIYRLEGDGELLNTGKLMVR